MKQFFASLFFTAFFMPEAQAASHTVKVVSFNILAPPWASPTGYPEACVPFLARETRRARIIALLDSLKESTDIFCLQEVTPIEYSFIKEALTGFNGIQVSHAPTYWPQYVTDDVPWELNGNAILIKSSVFNDASFSPVSLAKEGNCAAFMEAVHQASGSKIRLFCVHLDSDSEENREAEIDDVIAFLGPLADSVDLIVGDLNSDPPKASYCEELAIGGYRDLHDAVGNTDFTYPTAVERSTMEYCGELDHILIRNGTPLEGGVINLGLYDTFPIVEGHLHDDDRMTASLRLTGSDHFAVWGAFAL